MLFELLFLSFIGLTAPVPPSHGSALCIDSFVSKAEVKFGGASGTVPSWTPLIPHSSHSSHSPHSPHPSLLSLSVFEAAGRARLSSSSSSFVQTDNAGLVGAICFPLWRCDSHAVARR